MSALLSWVRSDFSSGYTLFSPCAFSMPQVINTPRSLKNIRHYGAFIRKEMRVGRGHYYLQLLQVGGLLLKNYGVFPYKQYSLFKRRFSNTLSSILSGEGLDERERGVAVTFAAPELDRQCGSLLCESARRSKRS